MGRGSFIGLSAAAAAFVFATSVDLRAADLRPGAIAAGPAGAQLALECDNGRTYPIRPRAVSDAGELVTGYLYTSPRSALYFRLIPMGNGYRYSGIGFWFDGVRGEATLDMSAKQANCTVNFGA